MANNYDQGTMQPDVPKAAIFDHEIALLKLFGFDCEESDNESLYFYLEDGILPPDCQEVEDVLTPEEIAQVKADPEYADALDEPIEDNLWIDILQNVLMRAPEIAAFTIMGCYYCSKMRPGEFGGWVYFVTANDFRSGGTGLLAEQFLKDMRDG